MRGTILVLGATGEVGGRVLAGLVERGWPARGATRAPARAARAAREGKAEGAAEASWVGLDLTRPASFGPALDGVERLFLIARPGDDQPERLAAPLLAAARAAGVTRVVDLSAMGVEREAGFGLRRVERLVEEAGVAWTHLRPNFFMQIFAGPPLLPVIRATGTIRMPAADARLSYVDTRDIAAVAVAALTEAGHAGHAYTLTGPEALDHAEVAARLSAAAGAEIGYVALSEAAARTELAASGSAPERIERLIGFYRRVRTGAWGTVSGDVAAVLGRPAREFRAFAAEYAGCWRGAGPLERPPAGAGSSVRR